MAIDSEVQTALDALSARITTMEKLVKALTISVGINPTLKAEISSDTLVADKFVEYEAGT